MFIVSLIKAPRKAFKLRNFIDIISRTYTPSLAYPAELFVTMIISVVRRGAKGKKARDGQA